MLTKLFNAYRDQPAKKKAVLRNIRKFGTQSSLKEILVNIVGQLLTFLSSEKATIKLMSLKHFFPYVIM